LARLLGVVETISAVALFALMALVCSSITSRYLFNYPFADWFDLSRLLLGIAVFWGIAAACGRDDHIRGDLVWDRLPERVRPWLDLLGRAMILIFVALLLWKFFGKFIDVRRTGQETAELRLPIWPFYAIAWLATPLAALALVAQVVLGMTRYKALVGDIDTEPPVT
jgi:TRAP-type C4-dicarboxylate transport system permease small subunit